MGVSPVISSSTLIISTVLVGHDGLPIVLLPHLVENDQHHCSHECDGHSLTNDDLVVFMTSSIPGIPLFISVTGMVNVFLSTLCSVA